MPESGEEVKLDCLHDHIFSNTNFLSLFLLLWNFDSPEEWSSRICFFLLIFQKATEKGAQLLECALMACKGLHVLEENKLILSSCVISLSSS